jgi:hypothetical protein
MVGHQVHEQEREQGEYGIGLLSLLLCCGDKPAGQLFQHNITTTTTNNITRVTATPVAQQQSTHTTTGRHCTASLPDQGR